MISYKVLIATDPKDGQLGVSLEKSGEPVGRQERIVADFFRELLSRATESLALQLLAAGELDGAMTMTGDTAKREGEEFKGRVNG